MVQPRRKLPSGMIVSPIIRLEKQGRNDIWRLDHSGLNGVERLLCRPYVTVNVFLKESLVEPDKKRD